MTDASTLPTEVKEFVRISAILTGFSQFELFGTGQAQSYYDYVLEQAKEELATLMETLCSTPDATAEGKAFVKANLFDTSNDKLINFTKSVIKLWYLGAWINPNDTNDVTFPSDQSYPSGLAWDAVHAHPQAAKQQGFGAWTIPPIGIEG